MNADPPSVRAVQAEEGRAVTCPEWLDALIRQLLAKRPADRGFNARSVEGVLLQHLLDEFGEEEARKLTRLDPVESAPENVHSGAGRPWVLWLILAAMLAGLAIAAAQNGG